MEKVTSSSSVYTCMKFISLSLTKQIAALATHPRIQAHVHSHILFSLFIQNFFLDFHVPSFIFSIEIKSFIFSQRLYISCTYMCVWWPLVFLRSIHMYINRRIYVCIRIWYEQKKIEKTSFLFLIYDQHNFYLVGSPSRLIYGKEMKHSSWPVCSHHLLHMCITI